VDENLRGQNFVGYTGEHSIRGHLRDQSGEPFRVFMSLECVQEPYWRRQASPGDDGYYVFDGVVAGFDYVLIPMGTRCDYEPPSRTYENLREDHDGQDFTVSHCWHHVRISGRVTDTRAGPVEGVRITFESARGMEASLPHPSRSGCRDYRTWTDACGYYKLMVRSDEFPGRVFPEKRDCTFEPAMREYPDPGEESALDHEDYIAHCVHWAVTGSAER
jgi:hypothetical protein